MTTPDKVSRIVDPIIGALIDRLPSVGSAWPLDERMLWLTTCEAALNLIYGPVDRIELRGPIVWSRQESGETSSTVEPPAPKRAAPETMSTAVAGAALLQGEAELEVVGDETSAGIQPTEAALKALVPSDAQAPKSRERPGPKPRDVESPPRPEGIPTTFGMIRDVLEEKPGLTAREVVAAIAERWWPGLQLKTIGPDLSTAVTKGRLSRDTDGKLTLTERGKNLVSTDARVANKGTFPPKLKTAEEIVIEEVKAGRGKHDVDPGVVAAVMKAESKPAATPPARTHKPLVNPLGTIKFEHQGRIAMLSTGREYSIAGKLRAAMGKGHVAEAFLAETVLGSNTENNRLVVRDICRNLCTPLAAAGLTIEHYPGFGLIMKDV